MTILGKMVQVFGNFCVAFNSRYMAHYLLNLSLCMFNAIGNSINAVNAKY